MTLPLRIYLSIWLVLSVAGRGQDGPSPRGTKVPEPPLPTLDPPPQAEVPAPTGPFSFDQVRFLSAELARKPYLNRTPELPAFWRNLTPRDMAKITCRPEQALWATESVGYALEFVHPSSFAPQTMQIAEIKVGQPKVVGWQSTRFDYHDLEIPEATPPPANFAGVNVLFPLNQPEKLEGLMEIGQHGHLRCRAPGLEFGVNSAALVLNPGTDREEFPPLLSLWFERPAAPTKACNFYALLDHPAVSGAYRFKLLPGISTTLEVEAELFFRQPVKSFGIAPLRSQCWFTEMSTPKPPDYHPELHSSDGLLAHLADSEAVWRTLDASLEPRHFEIATERLLGFGLVQRDRQFSSYQDLEERYELRPSAYLRPVGKWPTGKIQLREQPAVDAHSDNILAYWEPNGMPQVGQPLRFGYLLHWSGDIGAPGLSKVLSSRRTEQRFPVAEKRPTLVTIVVDFSQSASLEVDQKEVLAAIALTAGAKLLDKQTKKNPSTGGWRSIFHLQIDPTTDKVEINCRLLCEGRPISERWNYLWIK